MAQLNRFCFLGWIKPVDVEFSAYIKKMIKANKSFFHKSNLPKQIEVDRLWAEEVERRIAQIEKRKVKLVAIEKLFSVIRKKYKR